MECEEFLKNFAEIFAVIYARILADTSEKLPGAA